MNDKQIRRERTRYVSGEITLDEFEERVERILDPNRRPPLSSLHGPAARKTEALLRGEY